MNVRLQKLFAVAAAICITATSVMFQAPRFAVPAAAKTLEEIAQEKKEKQAEIDAKKEKLASLQNDITQKEAYQQTLQEQIKLISGKMYLIDTQLQTVNQDIYAKEMEIAELESKIAEEQVKVDAGLATFKSRIRTLYVHGNDSLLSALMGASDFYEVLAKLDLIRRISKHDNDMIDNLRKDIQSLTKNQQDLTASVQALSLKQTEMEVLRGEFKSSMTDLDNAYAETDDAKELLQQEELLVEGTIEEYEGILDDLSEEEEAIIRAAEEAAKKAAAEATRTTTTTTTTTTTKKTTTTTTATTTTTTTTTSKSTSTSTSTSTSKNGTTTSTKITGGNSVLTTPTTEKSGSTTLSSTSTSTTTTTTTTATTTKTTTTTTATTQPPKNPSNGVFAWPAPGYYHISSHFGPRWGRNHNGIDITGGGSSIHGANACAAGNGTVILVREGCPHDDRTMCGCNGGFGNYVVVLHPNGMSTYYAHMLYATVSVGDSVTTGTVVGKIGSTGNSTGPHLHFGVRKDNTWLDPEKYLY